MRQSSSIDCSTKSSRIGLMRQSVSLQTTLTLQGAKSSLAPLTGIESA